MTAKTRTYFTTRWHDYTENTPCTDPKTCTTRRHWRTGDNEYKTIEDAQRNAAGDDAPATRIVRITETLTRETVEVG